MKCWVCKNEDELSNMVCMQSDTERQIYVHRKCANKHNKEVNKTKRSMDAYSVASYIANCDYDASSVYEVERFLRERPKEAFQHLMGKQKPSAIEIAQAGAEQRYRSGVEWLAKELTGVEAWPAEPGEDRVTGIVEHLKEYLFPFKDETPQQYATRLLLAAEAQRKFKVDDDAAYEEFLRSEEKEAAE